MREYLRILKALLQTGKVDFDGEFYQAHETIPEPLDVPVMASALQRGSFELCGADADGAISWICPPAYLRDVALPAMAEGAKQAGRPVPPLIAHAPVCVHGDAAEVRAAVQQQLTNPKLPYYQRMLIDAGFPEAAQGDWSDAMVDEVVFWGDETRVAEKIKGMFSLGASEVLVSPIGAGPRPGRVRTSYNPATGRAGQESCWLGAYWLGVGPTGATAEVTPICRLFPFALAVRAHLGWLGNHYVPLAATCSASLGIDLSGTLAIGTVCGSVLLT